MRLLWLILIVASCTACQHSHQATGTRLPRSAASGFTDLWPWTAQFESASYEFDLPDAAMHCKTKWDAEKGAPPLTPHQAEEMAKKEAARLRADVPGWNCDHVDLIQADRRDSWFYVAYLYRGDFIMGRPEFFTIPVLMSGVAVHPISANRTLPVHSNSAPTTSKTTLATYLRQVQSAYMQAWEAPTRPKDFKKAIKVSVVLAKNGSVISSKITDQSGDEELDRSVRKVLERVKSVQPFEDSAKDERRTVTVTFKLNS